MDEKQTFFKKITEMTGKNEREIYQMYLDSHFEKHSEIRTFFIEKLELSYGFANTLAHYVSKTDGTSLSEGKTMDELLDEIYSKDKAKFRPIHEELISEIKKFGDFEMIPKKGYMSLKQKRQFAMIGPKTNNRMEIGINGKNLKSSQRLEEQPKGSMCQYIVKITDLKDVDQELIGWLYEAYQQSK